MHHLSIRFVAIFITLFQLLITYAQKPFFASDQRVFTTGILSELNAAYMGLTDHTYIGVEGSYDWSGFEGNPQTGVLFGSSQIGQSNSFGGAGLKLDKIAAFKRTQFNLAYAYNATLSDNYGYKPIRLLIGMQPHIDFFRSNYDGVFEELYPMAVPPEGLDQTTFGFNAGFFLTNRGFDNEEENTWHAGLSTRMSGLRLTNQQDGVTDIRHRELIFVGGLRQNVNYEDLYFLTTGFVTHSEAGLDLAVLINLEKHNPERVNAKGGWAGIGFKTNTQSLIGAKQLLVQGGLIRYLIEGEKKLLRMGAFVETDLGPYTLLGSRFGLIAIYQD